MDIGECRYYLLAAQDYCTWAGSWKGQVSVQVRADPFGALFPDGTAYIG
jgi:hypothetical protein